MSVDISPLIRLMLMDYLTNNINNTGVSKGLSPQEKEDFAALLALAMAGSSTKTTIPLSPGGVGKTARTVTGASSSSRTAGAYKTGSTGSKASVSASGLEGLIENAARKYGVDPALVKSLVQAESSFDPTATSSAGAMGLMQLMPGTASSLGVNDPYDPAQNVDGGVRYLKQMLNRYGGDVSLALAAYNAGPGAVDEAGGVPNYRETVDYVRKVLKNRVNFTA